MISCILTVYIYWKVTSICSIDNVRDHLQMYFENARQIVSKKEDVLELALLVVHCLEVCVYTIQPAF